MSKAQIRGKGHYKSQMGPGKHENKIREDAFIYNLGVLIGCVAEIQTTCGEKYEGVLSAFNHQSLKIMIEAAHEPTDDDESTITNHYDLIIVPPEKIAFIKFKDAELSYATRDFETDTAISAGRKINLGDKELTPWEGAEDFIDGGMELEGGQNGWEARDMFRKNEENFGVTTTYTDDLMGYTTQIDKNSDTYRKQEEQARMVAQEIEGNTSSWERTKVENGGEDEEEAFSAVLHPSRNNNNNSQSNTQSGPSGGAGKYVVPSRRQEQQGNPSQTNQHHPGNANGPPQINNNQNNRKPYGSGAGVGGNQNARGPYGQPSNNYHDRHGGHDRSRGPPPNQAHPFAHGPHGVVRDENIRQQRPGNKGPGDRGGGPDGKMGKSRLENLSDFSKKFRMQTDSGSGHPPRMRVQHQHQHHPRVPGPPMHGPPPMASYENVLRNAHPPPTAEFDAMQISSNTPPKPKKVDGSPVPPLIPGPASTNSENSSSASGTDSPRSTTTNSASANSSSPSPSVSAAIVHTTPASENTSISTSILAGESSSASSVSSGGEVKSAEPEKKKTFTFNVNAKEFNPNAKPFQPRSPSTPPRPPSTPASNPPALAAQPSMQHVVQSYVPHNNVIYQSYPTHAQMSMPPPSHSAAPPAGATPRQRHPKNMMQHVQHQQQQQRPEMTPQLQMTAGPPLAIQSAGGQPPFYVQQTTSGFQATSLVRLPQHTNVIPTVYSNEVNSGGHVQHLHYIQHNGAAAHAGAGHQAAQHHTNALAQQSAVPSNTHGYSHNQAASTHGQQQYLYPSQMIHTVGLPYQIQLMPYHLPQQGGNSAGMPHSQ